MDVETLLGRYGAAAFGVLGALIGLSFVERATPLVALVALVSGLAVAVLGAPVVLHYLPAPAEIRDYALAGAAFVLGIVGFALAGAVHATAASLRTTLPAAVTAWLNKRAGG